MLLVTGITGHTGRYFLEELIKNKYEGPIRCVVRESSDTNLLDNSGLKIEKSIGDLNDTKFINRIMQGVKVVLHIYNIHHSPQIIEEAIKNNVERTILVHTTGIYSKFKYASEEYKLIEEKVYGLIKNSNSRTELTILRPTMIYGDLIDSNISKFIRMMDKLKVMPVINGGNSLIQPVNARDLGKAYYTVLMNPEQTNGKSYDLSGEKPLKMIDMFKAINKELNKKVIFLSVPLKVGVLMATGLKTVSLNKIDYVERVQRMGENRSYSHNEANKDFAYTPMTFEEGIEIEVKEYKMQNGSQ